MTPESATTRASPRHTGSEPVGVAELLRKPLSVGERDGVEAGVVLALGVADDEKSDASERTPAPAASQLPAPPAGKRTPACE